MLANDLANGFWDTMATLLGADDQYETITRWARGNQFLAECADEARGLL
jgi:hypothetical protein